MIEGGFGIFKVGTTTSTSSNQMGVSHKKNGAKQDRFNNFERNENNLLKGFHVANDSLFSLGHKSINHIAHMQCQFMVGLSSIFPRLDYYAYI